MPRCAGCCAPCSIQYLPDLDVLCALLYNQQMNSYGKYKIKFLCYYEPMDKIWGWLLPSQQEPMQPTYSSGWHSPQTAYAFWAVTGKTIRVNTHAYYRKGDMHGLERRKIGNKYVEMPVDELLERWPQFWEQLEQAIIFHKLSEG
jgi:hypothetical protein